MKNIFEKIVKLADSRISEFEDDIKKLIVCIVDFINDISLILIE